MDNTGLLNSLEGLSGESLQDHSLDQSQVGIKDSVEPSSTGCKLDKESLFSLPKKPQFGSSHQRTLSDQCNEHHVPLTRNHSKRFSLNSMLTQKELPTEYFKNLSTPVSPNQTSRSLQLTNISESGGAELSMNSHSRDSLVDYIQGTDMEAFLRNRQGSFSSKEPYSPGNDKGKSPRKERRFGRVSISSTCDNTPLSITQVLETANSADHLPSFNSINRSTSPNSKSSDTGSPTTKVIVQRLVNDFSQLEAGCEPVWERCEQSIDTARILTRFFRKRAGLEEEYGKNMNKLVQMTLKEFEKETIKEGTFGDSLKGLLDAHEDIGKIRVKLSSHFYSLAEELSYVAKEKEALRKAQKETDVRLKKNIAEAEATLEKVKSKFLQASEGWDKAITNKLEQSHLDAEQAAYSQSPTHHSSRTQNAIVDAFNNIFSANKSGDALRKQEEDTKSKANSSKRLYHQQHTLVNHMRHDYFYKQLPDLISESLGVLEDTDQTTKSFLDLYISRYLASNQETINIISPKDPEKGLRSLVDKIDVHKDNLDFFSRQLSATRPVYRDAYEIVGYTMSKVAKSVLNPKVVYGMNLQEQLTRDGTSIPTIVVKCVKFIEKHGITQEGIYRRSGSSVKVNKLKDLFNLDASDIDLETLDAASDVDNVTGALKLYLRELPEAVIPSTYWSSFLVAHKEDHNEQSQLDTLKSALAKLPDANLNLLKYMMLHLKRVASHEDENKMSISNLSIVFGPTLFPPSQKSNAVELMGQQCGVTMLLIKFSDTLFDELAL